MTPASDTAVVMGDGSSTKKTIFIRAALFCIAVTITLSSIAIVRPKIPRLTTPAVADSSANAPEQMFDHLGRYIMHNFDQKKPMANFLSGLSGFWGVPMVRTNYASFSESLLFTT